LAGGSIQTKSSEEEPSNVIIIGANYHPGFQQIAFVDTAQQRDVATLVSSYLFEHGLRQYFVPVITQLQPFESCASTNPPLIELPRRFVTQTLSWLSILIPLPLQPVCNFSTLLGSAAGKRATCPARALLTQIRSCWSITKVKGPKH